MPSRPSLPRTRRNCPVRDRLLHVRGRGALFHRAAGEAGLPGRARSSACGSAWALRRSPPPPRPRRCCARATGRSSGRPWTGSRTRERTVGDAALDETLNLNMFFSYFFAGGLTPGQRGVRPGHLPQSALLCQRGLLGQGQPALELPGHTSGGRGHGRRDAALRVHPADKERGAAQPLHRRHRCWSRALSSTSSARR